MKKLLAILVPALALVALLVGRLAAGPEPSVGLYWYIAVDPTIAPGVCAPQWQLAIRTDVPGVYAHTGTSCTAWLGVAGTAAGAVTGGPGNVGAFPKWTGPTAIGSTGVVDDGANFIISSNGGGPASRQWQIFTDLHAGATNHAALAIFSQGVGLTNGADGGLQSNQSSTIDTTAQAFQTLAVFAGNTATKSAGANTLTNYGVLATATGGDSNFSFFGLHGLLENVEGAVLSGSITLGTATTGTTQINGPLSVTNTQTVSLGSNVSQMILPAGTNFAINIGDPTTNDIVNIRNTGGVQRFVGVDLEADTTRNASAIPHIRLDRGAGGAGLQGFLEVTDGSVYSSANDTVVGANTSQALVLVSNNVVGMKLNATGNIELGGNSGTKEICAIGTTAPTTNHGTLSGDSTNCVGRITAIGANSTFTLTLGGTTGFTALAHCFIQVISGTGNLNVYVSTVSSTAPVFSCANTTTGAAANCPDVDYWCLGH